MPTFDYTGTPRRLSGGRGCPRPPAVVPCPQCGEPAGHNYSGCPACRAAVDQIWQADWTRLLAAESIQSGSEDEALLAAVILTEQERHPWTIVDVAMSLTRCPSCGGELGGGPVDCQECRFAFGNLWAYDVEASAQGAMTGNEHAIRVGRYILRHPHRYSEKVVAGWSVSMPILITGAEPPGAKDAQALSARFWDGKLDPAAEFSQSFGELVERYVRPK